MSLWTVALFVFAAYVINNILLIVLKKKWGENEYSDKVLSNSGNIISCIIGIMITLVAIKYADFLKWPLIIFYTLAFLYEFIVAFLISFVLQVIMIFSKERLEKESWYTIFSNLIAAIVYGFIAYSILIKLFY